MVDGARKEALLRLAGLVTERRWVQLGFRQDQLAYGPSTTTMTQIEAGVPVSDLSYRKLDQSLGWQEGTCKSILAGGDPAVVVRQPPQRLDPKRDLFGGGQPRDFEAELAAIPVTKVDTSPLAELLLAKRTSPAERTSEQWAVIRAADERRQRQAAAAQRFDAERPFIELVWDGQRLAALKNDADVDAYVREVESAVVGMVGIDRLNDALDARLSEWMLIRANKAGVLREFMDEVDRLRESGVDDRDINALLAVKLDELLPRSQGRETAQSKFRPGGRVVVRTVDEAGDEESQDGGGSDGSA
ncbi:hypothetical protein SBI67_20025 [Mycolicibacterium sp. 120266]|uniref:hypothetical protein n=1 Tax=Mycolicibacterium sp. 120266 TaxID=3090601 RepID=UPI00299E441F|nr:hypothetical protein [Mycolicibacterium sp. 120266]MDX1874415.1 hypothetical protein [Mycolicibacterium sp. 120266]